MKCAILITARLKSQRLPLKVLKKIHGKPMIKHMLDRLKLAKRPESIIICTSMLEQDFELVRIADEEKVQSFQGDADDVLQRLLDAANLYHVDTIINCTADNPFVDPIYIDKLYDFHVSEGNDFTKINGLPWGVFSYAISKSALQRACELKDETDTENWHAYFTAANHFKWSSLDVTDNSLLYPELRLTVDTIEDFTVITKIFDELYENNQVFQLKDIIRFCNENPNITEINSSIEQKKGIPIKFKKAKS